MSFYGRTSVVKLANFEAEQTVQKRAEEVPCDVWDRSPFAVGSAMVTGIIGANRTGTGQPTWFDRSESMELHYRRSDDILPREVNGGNRGEACEQMGLDGTRAIIIDAGFFFLHR